MTPQRSRGAASCADRAGTPVVAVFTTDETAHGLNRYARTLATALTAGGVRAVEVPLPRNRPFAAARAAFSARRADVVHLQFTDRYLGSGGGQFLTAVAVRLALLGRPLVVTAHDFHTPRAEVVARRRDRGYPWRRSTVRRVVGDLGFDATARSLLATAGTVLTCSARERELLAWTRPRRSEVVPHYVQTAGDAGTGATGTVDDALLVVVGFIHRRKGQHLAVAALPHLPGARLVLAGSATGRNTAYLREVEDLAGRLGVADRLHVTGPLSEEEMTSVLRSARAALAPYQRIAASGSIATLVGAGVPLVARRSDYTRELAEACPTAVHLFDGEDPEALARAVAKATGEPLDAQRAELRAHAAALSPAVTARRHLAVYRTLLPAGDPRAVAELDLTTHEEDARR